MVTAPTWQAATAGQTPRAGHINELLGPHTSYVLYNGTQTAGQTTNGATTTSTNGLYLAQSFTTAVGQTAVGLITASLTTTTSSGTLLSPTVVSLHADNAGAPAASALVSTTLTAEFAFNASGAVNTTRIGIPLPVTGLTASTTYWIVASAAGNVSNNFTWFRSNQVSGASTSTNGTTWTAQSYGFTFTVRDQGQTSPLVKSSWEDGGARWTFVVYNATNGVSVYYEYTAGQTTSGYIQSVRNLSYQNGVLLSST